MSDKNRKIGRPVEEIFEEEMGFSVAYDPQKFREWMNKRGGDKENIDAMRAKLGLKPLFPKAEKNDFGTNDTEIL